MLRHMYSLCLCHSKKPYSECCEKILIERAHAKTPEALMRSRYVAFCQKNMAYLLKSTDPETRAAFNSAANLEWAESVTFSGLEILKSTQTGEQGVVEFKARYIHNGQEHVHHENSTFRQIFGVWYFCSGQVFE